MPATPQPHRPPGIADPSVQAADAWLRRFQAAVITVMAAVAGAVGAIAFFTSFEAIKAYAQTSKGITPQHSWAVPLLVDSFIVMATGADLWLSAARQRRWWEVAWPKLLLAGAAAVSFVLNVAHAGTSDWPARGVAAIPPAALVLSVELLVLIVRRAAIARTARLATASRTSSGEAIVVARGDHATTTMVAPTGDRPALPASSPTDRRTAGTHAHHSTANGAGDHQRQATSDRQATTPAGRPATAGDHTGGGATYRRVRELYVGGVTVAAEIARELGVSASYAQRTLRRVKGDLARQPSTPATGPGRLTTPERTHQATSDYQERKAARSPDHPPAPDRDQEATGRDEATRDGDGRTTSDWHLALVASDRDHNRDRGEVER